jgi:hypothetical protein
MPLNHCFHWVPVLEPVYRRSPVFFHLFHCFLPPVFEFVFVLAKYRTHIASNQKRPARVPVSSSVGTPPPESSFAADKTRDQAVFFRLASFVFLF